MVQKREYGIDLLRVICMTGIVGAHVLVAGREGLATRILPDATNLVLYLLEFFTHFTVNLFPIITGYFYAERKSVKSANLIGLLVNLEAYSLIFTVVLYIFSTNFLTDIPSILGSLFPITAGAYWYLAAYVMVFLLIPWMNLLIRNMSKNQYSTLIVSLFVLFCVIPAFSKVDYFAMQDGYSPYWLIFLYFLGGYIRLYKDLHINRLRKYWYVFIFVANTCIAMLLYLLTVNQIISPEILAEHTRFIAPISLINVMCMMFLFMDMNITSSGAQKLVVSLSGAAFDVYMIHCHNYVYDIFIRGKFRFLTYCSVWEAILYYVLIVTAIYMIGWISCGIRKKIFKWIGVDWLVQTIGSKIDTLQKKIWA